MGVVANISFLRADLGFFPPFSPHTHVDPGFRKLNGQLGTMRRRPAVLGVAGESDVVTSEV